MIGYRLLVCTVILLCTEYVISFRFKLLNRFGRTNSKKMKLHVIDVERLLKSNLNSKTILDDKFKSWVPRLHYRQNKSNPYFVASDVSVTFDRIIRPCDYYQRYSFITPYPDEFHKEVFKIPRIPMKYGIDKPIVTDALYENGTLNDYQHLITGQDDMNVLILSISFYNMISIDQQGFGQIDYNFFYLATLEVISKLITSFYSLSNDVTTFNSILDDMIYKIDSTGRIIDLNNILIDSVCHIVDKIHSFRNIHKTKLVIVDNDTNIVRVVMLQDDYHSVLRHAIGSMYFYLLDQWFANHPAVIDESYRTYQTELIIEKEKLTKSYEF